MATVLGRRWRRWFLAVVAALVVLGLGIGLGLTIGSSRTSTTPTTAPIHYICGTYKNGQPGGACVPAPSPQAKTITPVEPHRVRLPVGG